MTSTDVVPRIRTKETRKSWSDKLMEELHNTEKTASHQSQQSPNVLVHVEELWSKARCQNNHVHVTERNRK